MFIRYFARTDDTDVGRAAAAYCDELVATGIPVRLVSTRVAELQFDARGRYKGAWDRHRQLLVTPMDDSFVNVVCGIPTDWTRFHTPSAKNVLMLVPENFGPQVSQPVLIEAFTLYRMLFVQSAEVADIVERVIGHRPLVANPDELRRAFTGGGW